MCGRNLGGEQMIRYDIQEEELKELKEEALKQKPSIYSADTISFKNKDKERLIMTSGILISHDGGVEPYRVVLDGDDAKKFFELLTGTVPNG